MTVMEIFHLLLHDREPLHLLNFPPYYQPLVDALYFRKTVLPISKYITVIIRTVITNVNVRENIASIKNSHQNNAKISFVIKT